MTAQLQFPGGSVWRKWDLHVHSPLSILNNQFPHSLDGSPDWDAYITKLEQAGLSVLGITDYFTIEGYKKVREFKEAGRLGKVDLILPNIEFRLKTIISSRKDEKHMEEIRLNLHVLFSDEVAIQDIDEHFLHDLNFSYQADPQNPTESES